jgi:hypothetical protein
MIIKNFKWALQRRKYRIKKIRIASIFEIAIALNLIQLKLNPEIEYYIQAKMKSGKTAVYKYSDCESAWGTDWCWYIFSFHHWLEDGEFYPTYC